MASESDLFVDMNHWLSLFALPPSIDNFEALSKESKFIDMRNLATLLTSIFFDTLNIALKIEVIHGRNASSLSLVGNGL